MTSYRLLGLGAGPREVGLVGAAFALVPLFIAIPLGRRADSPRGGSLIVGGSGLEVVACLLLAIARSPLSLAGASALLGLGHLGVALGAQAVIARESPYERHDRDFGWLTAGVSLGQLAGPLLAGLIVGNRTGAALAPAAGHAMLAGAGVAFVALLCGLLAERGHTAPAPPIAPHLERTSVWVPVIRTPRFCALAVCGWVG